MASMQLTRLTGRPDHCGVEAGGRSNVAVDDGAIVVRDDDSERRYACRGRALPQDAERRLRLFGRHERMSRSAGSSGLATGKILSGPSPMIFGLSPPWSTIAFAYKSKRPLRMLMTLSPGSRSDICVKRRKSDEYRTAAITSPLPRRI
jgi:hypothetical protein